MGTRTRPAGKSSLKASKESFVLDPRTFTGASLEHRRKGFLWLRNFRSRTGAAQSYKKTAHSSGAAERKATRTVASVG